ncbi:MULTISPECIES: Ig-like domain-containing protein, partial [Bacteroidota]|uniref:Ig-like domain-containing protein n=1 Tax=Polaribacter sp. TaxID=1920175 RepID=UPI004047F238
MFHYKKYLLLSILALFCISIVSAQTIIDQWTFTDATTPQNSDIKNKAMSTWDPALAGNSWAGGVLTWGYDNTAEFATSTVAFMGSPNLGVAGGTLSQLVLTIDAKDINFSQNGSYGWQFTGTTTGNVRARINSFNGNITMKMTGTGTEANSTNLYSQPDYASITNLQLTFTWDLVNDTMLMSANGSGNLAAGGTGTISYSDSFAQDLSGVTNLTGFRTYVQGQGTSFMQLDTVTIATMDNTGNTDNTPPEAPVISSATSTSVTGTAEPNSTITVYGEDGTTVLGIGTTDVSGNYTVNFTTAQLPCTTIKVSAKDASNNESQKTDGTVSDTVSGTPILRTVLLYSCFPQHLQTYVDTNPDEAQKGIIDVTLPPYN